VNLYTYLYYKWSKSHPFDHDNVIYSKVSVIDKVFVLLTLMCIFVCILLVGGIQVQHRRNNTRRNSYEIGGMTKVSWSKLTQHGSWGELNQEKPKHIGCGQCHGGSNP